MFNTFQIIAASVLAVLGIGIGPLSCRILNKIPAAWLCDYDEEPSEELKNGIRFKMKPTGIVISVTAAVVFACTALSVGISAELPVALILYCFLLLISASDAKYTIIPDQFTIAAAILSLVFAVIDFLTDKSFITTWYSPLLGAVCGGAILMLLDLFSTLIFKKAGFGFGDVKLMAALGLMFGLKYILVLLVIASFAAAINFLVIIFAGKAKKGIYLPMGPYICLAAALTVILQPLFQPVFDMYKLVLQMQVLP